METQRASAVQEDYLEAIIALEQLHGRVRVRDLSERLSVHKSTVTAALKVLREKGFITYEPYGRIIMTSAGRAMAERVQERHDLLKGFLRDVLLVDQDVAETNACRMEHVMEPALLERLQAFAKFMRKGGKQDRDGRDGFKTYLAEAQAKPSTHRDGTANRDRHEVM